MKVKQEPPEDYVLYLPPPVDDSPTPHPEESLELSLAEVKQEPPEDLPVQPEEDVEQYQAVHNVKEEPPADYELTLPPATLTDDSTAPQKEESKEKYALTLTLPLKTENKSHQPEDKTKKRSSVVTFRCTKCDISYSYANNMRHHLRTVHHKSEAPALQPEKNVKSKLTQKEAKEDPPKKKIATNLRQHHRTIHHKNEAPAHQPEKDVVKPKLTQEEAEEDPPKKKNSVFKPKWVKSVKLTKFDAKWIVKSKLFQAYFACTHCQHVVKGRHHLCHHMEFCGKLIPARFECDLCGIRFQQKRLMGQHIRRHSSVKNIFCTKCGFGFTSKLGLARHQKLKRIHKCADCSDKFSSKSLLDRHRIESHEGVLKCGKCSFKTKVNRDLTRHKTIHDKPISCETCQKTFSDRKMMKVHQKQHRHGIYATAPEETFTFYCEICNQPFSCPQYLRSHRKSVHDARQVECKVCGKICKNRIQHYHHSKIHVKVECSICNRMVNSSHFKIHKTIF